MSLRGGQRKVKNREWPVFYCGCGGLAGGPDPRKSSDNSRSGKAFTRNGAVMAGEAMVLSGIEILASGSIVSPFPRLRALLEGMEPGHDDVIDMTIGEPREKMPGFVRDKLTEAHEQFAKYPPIKGTEELRGAIAAWIERRYNLSGLIDPDLDILPLNGSREGLFYGVFPAVAAKRQSGDLNDGDNSAVLMPNPFYQTCAGAALAADCQPVYLSATGDTGFFPDLDKLAANEELLRRTGVFYLCSPANPQGAVADAGYLKRALELARRYNFMLFADECYSEIYAATPPIGALQVAVDMARGEQDDTAFAAATPTPAPARNPWRNLIVFNSLSKRSTLPGLRSGFCAGDRRFLSTLLDMRNLIGPQMPLPTQHLSAAVWREEQHVAVNRRAYRAKFDAADELLGNRYGYRRPAGGFFLWLNMSQYGGGIQAAVTLWKLCGVKVIPGAFLAQDDDQGANPGQDYIRIALVHDEAVVRRALKRIVSVLSLE